MGGWSVVFQLGYWDKSHMRDEKKFNNAPPIYICLKHVCHLFIPHTPSGFAVSDFGVCQECYCTANGFNTLTVIL